MMGVSIDFVMFTKSCLLTKTLVALISLFGSWVVGSLSFQRDWGITRVRYLIYLSCFTQSWEMKETLKERGISWGRNEFGGLAENEWRIEDWR